MGYVHVLAGLQTNPIHELVMAATPCFETYTVHSKDKAVFTIFNYP